MCVNARSWKHKMGPINPAAIIAHQYQLLWEFVCPMRRNHASWLNGTCVMSISPHPPHKSTFSQNSVLLHDMSVVNHSCHTWMRMSTDWWHVQTCKMTLMTCMWEGSWVGYVLYNKQAKGNQQMTLVRQNNVPGFNVEILNYKKKQQTVTDWQAQLGYKNNKTPNVKMAALATCR